MSFDMPTAQRMFALNYQKPDTTVRDSSGKEVAISRYFMPINKARPAPSPLEALQFLAPLSRQVGTAAAAAWGVLLANTHGATGVGYGRGRELGEALEVCRRTALAYMAKLREAGALSYEVLRGGVPGGLESGIIRFQIHEPGSSGSRARVVCDTDGVHDSVPGVCMTGDTPSGPEDPSEQVSPASTRSTRFMHEENIVSVSSINGEEGPLPHQRVLQHQEPPSPPPLEERETAHDIQVFLNGELPIKVSLAAVAQLLAESKSVVLSRGLEALVDFPEVVRGSLTRVLERHRERREGRTEIFGLAYFQASLMGDVSAACDGAHELARRRQAEEKAKAERRRLKEETARELERTRELDQYLDSLLPEERESLRIAAQELSEEQKRQGGGWGMPLVVAERYLASQQLGL